MKKKLRLYCGLLALVLVATSVCGILEYNNSSSTHEKDEKLYFGTLPEEFAKTDSIPGGVAKHFKPTLSLELGVQPRNYPDDEVLLSEVDGQVCRVDIQRVKLTIPYEQAMHSNSYIIALASIVPNMLLFVWLLVIILQVLRSVSRREVFVARIAKKLELAGILLVVIQLLLYLRSYILVQMLVSSVNMAYYDIKWLTSSPTYFIIGLALMIVSQIILMGKDLKEEQELTI